LTLEIAIEWARYMTEPKLTIQESGDDGYVRVDVSVKNIKREDGVYAQEVDPVIHFDMRHMFNAGCFAESFDSLEDMLVDCTMNYRNDEKFIAFVRSEHCYESMAI